MSDNTIQVTDENFETAVLRADKPVLVDFWAEWCPPCKMVEPIVAKIATEYQGQMIVGRCNTEFNPQVPSIYRITAIPTLILFKDGEEVERIVGYRDKAALKSAIDPNL